MKTYILFYILLSMLSSQAMFILDSTSTSLTINGTSTLHDWVSDVFSVKGRLETTSIDSVKIKSLKLIIDVKSIKSGKESMDENTYEELKSEDFPEIIFFLKELKNQKMEKESLKVEAIGQLEVAGISQELRLLADITLKERVIVIEGQKNLKMTDFNIDPPTMFLGTITTGNEIIIKYKLSFKYQGEKQ
jgi:polyisoprenoid-binding protein YceI